MKKVSSKSRNKKKKYNKPQLKKHSKIKPQSAEIFYSGCCGSSEFV